MVMERMDIVVVVDVVAVDVWLFQMIVAAVAVVDVAVAVDDVVPSCWNE